jgi:hypothetical protein
MGQTPACRAETFGTTRITPKSSTAGVPTSMVNTYARFAGGQPEGQNRGHGAGIGDRWPAVPHGGVKRLPDFMPPRRGRQMALPGRTGTVSVTRRWRYCGTTLAFIACADTQPGMLMALRRPLVRDESCMVRPLPTWALV